MIKMELSPSLYSFWSGAKNGYSIYTCFKRVILYTWHVGNIIRGGSKGILFFLKFTYFYLVAAGCMCSFLNSVYIVVNSVNR